jgi:hypothetical protein
MKSFGWSVRDSKAPDSVAPDSGRMTGNPEGILKS